jgi:hypothetical protein
MSGNASVECSNRVTIEAAKIELTISKTLIVGAKAIS